MHIRGWRITCIFRVHFSSYLVVLVYHNHSLGSVNYLQCKRQQFPQEIMLWTDMPLHISDLFVSACPSLSILWCTSSHNRLSPARRGVTGCMCRIAWQFVGKFVTESWWLRKTDTENHLNRRTDVSETSAAWMQLLMKLLSTYLNDSWLLIQTHIATAVVKSCKELQRKLSCRYN